MKNISELEKPMALISMLAYVGALICSIGYSIEYGEPSIAILPVVWYACSFDKFLDCVKTVFLDK